MRARDLQGKNIVIWGTGREGLAAAHFIRRFTPGQPLHFIDETPLGDTPDLPHITLTRGKDAIGAVLDEADVIIKSPGVSLYHPLLETPRRHNVPVTSLLNLWFAEPRTAKTVLVTGTKGKSTTASLLAHALNGLKQRTALLGNIGVPVTEADAEGLDYVVIETSSYQAANFDGLCDVAVLTSLYPEHLDWHGSLERYYRDKLNLLQHAYVQVVNAEAAQTIRELGLGLETFALSNTPQGFHPENGAIYAGRNPVGALKNSHLSRLHNLVNVCTVLTVIEKLGLDPIRALAQMEDFQGLPHRQQELGERGGVLYVNDSISTTPQSAIAAMEAYRGRPITVIVGGHDRGIDYTPLVDYLAERKIPTILCMGPSGARIAAQLRARRPDGVHDVADMAQTIELARQHTPAGGVILLSPAAPSYGLFKNFEARGAAFAATSGFPESAKTPQKG